MSRLRRRLPSLHHREPSLLKEARGQQRRRPPRRRPPAASGEFLTAWESVAVADVPSRSRVVGASACSCARTRRRKGARVQFTPTDLVVDDTRTRQAEDRNCTDVAVVNTPLPARAPGLRGRQRGARAHHDVVVIPEPQGDC